MLSTRIDALRRESVGQRATPWMIGFANFYDHWRWLTFLPVAVPLWAPALMYLYVYALVYGRWPASAWRILLPGTVEFTFQAVSFLLPLSPKLHWANIVAPIAGPIFAIALIVAFALQAWASLKLLNLHGSSDRYGHLRCFGSCGQRRWFGTWRRHSHQRSLE